MQLKFKVEPKILSVSKKSKKLLISTFLQKNTNFLTCPLVLDKNE